MASARQAAARCGEGAQGRIGIPGKGTQSVEGEQQRSAAFWTQSAEQVKWRSHRRVNKLPRLELRSVHWRPRNALVSLFLGKDRPGSCPASSLRSHHFELQLATSTGGVTRSILTVTGTFVL